MALSKILPASQEQYVGARNMVTNGAMTINQRGDVTGITATTYGGPDRWELGISGLGTHSISQSSTAPDGFSNSYKVDCTTADANPASSDFLVVSQKIEAQNLQHLQYGSSSAQQLTLSFYVRSNKTGTYVCELVQPDASNRHISKSYTISSANTWEYKTITFAGDSSGVINNDNGVGFYVNWWLGAGTGYNPVGGTLQTSWGAFDQTARAVGNVNLADSTSNEWYITGVQLEVGEATPFEHRSYGDEIARCQRYYVENGPLLGFWTTASYFRQTICFPVEMRSAPTISIIDTNAYHEFYSLVGYNGISSIPFADGDTLGADFLIASSANRGRAYGDPSKLYQREIAFDAEL